MKIKLSNSVSIKLRDRHRVSLSEIVECFANRMGGFVIDTREDHLTNPLTRWFVSETDSGRKLKIAFIPLHDEIVIKTAYNANPDEIAIYKNRAKIGAV